MVFLAMWVVLALAGLFLWRFLARRAGDPDWWISALVVGASLGLVRGFLACAGWYTVERASGPLQVPAFALALLALPEAMLLGRRHVTPATWGFLTRLFLLLLAGTMLLVFCVGLVSRLVARKPKHSAPVDSLR